MRNLVCTAVVLGALALSGCGSTPPATSTTPTGAVTVRAANGTITIPTRPQRIVSLAPTATESLYAVGAGKQVVAVDELSNFPANAPRTSLSGFKPNAEAVIAYRPDLVVISSDAGGILAALQKVKVPVLLEPAAAKLQDVYQQIDDLGTATGHAAQAAAVTAGMKQKIDAAVRATPRPAKPLTYYHELTNDLYTVTSKTFIGQVYALFGLTNIADSADKQGSGYPQLSQEALVSADPSLIFLADAKCCAQNARTVATRPGWSGLTAVRTGRVIQLDDDIASRWGPRVVDLVQRISLAIRESQQTPSP